MLNPTGYSYQTIANAKSIMARTPPDVLQPGLTLTHYEIASSLPKPEQKRPDDLMAWSEECPECGKEMTVTDDRENYQWLYKCLHCGYEEMDDYIDLFGCMSVPYGFV